jgi:hypothetical protein
MLASRSISSSGAELTAAFWRMSALRLPAQPDVPARTRLTHRVISAAIGIGAVLRPPITIAMNFGCLAIEM